MTEDIIYQTGTYVIRKLDDGRCMLCRAHSDDVYFEDHIGAFDMLINLLNEIESLVGMKHEVARTAAVRDYITATNKFNDARDNYINALNHMKSIFKLDLE